MKQTLYLETSVVGAYLDNGEPFRRDLTIRWWEHELSEYDAFSSILVTRDDGASRAIQAAAGVDVAELLPDGRVVAGDAERHLRVFSPNGAVLADLELPVRMMSLRREGPRLIALPSYLAAASPPLVVDVEHPRVDARLEGHTGQVFSARWIARGRILTAGAEGTAHVWDGRIREGPASLPTRS